MKLKLQYIFLLSVLVSCQKEIKIANPSLHFEKINYFKYPAKHNDIPFQYRLTYYFDNGEPHRWMVLDSSGRVMTDYIYEYDKNWQQTGARYREESVIDFSIEKVRFKNDSTKITEWIDSTGQIYYRMIDNLNKDKKTYRAAFIGDKLHGYDSTFYTKEGFEKRIFFTNTKGKVFNDRIFKYDSIGQNGDWVERRKIMQDTVRELHKREVYYDNNFVSANGRFFEGIVSTGELSENMISFSADESLMFLTRTSDWNNQSAFIAQKKNGIYTVTIPVMGLDTIYNGTISPNGDKIIYSVRTDNKEEIWLVRKGNDEWSNKINLTESSGIQGGYFNWLSESEIYFQTIANEGDIVVGKLKNDVLTIVENLHQLNTEDGTEFSPYIDERKRFIIFTRFTEDDESNQGFFISYNNNDYDNPEWSIPKKLNMLPYGWSANIINNETQFIYSDGEDIYSVPIEVLNLH